MIFDGIHSGHMMDWSLDSWLFLIIIGVIVFFVITLILLYIMRKGTRELEQATSSNLNVTTEELRTNQQYAQPKFCPECGIELREENLAFCPSCGSEISK